MRSERAKNSGLFTTCEEARFASKPNELRFYWTVTVSVEDDLTEPDAPARPAAGVAVMVAVEVVDVVVLVDDPPQPDMNPKPVKRTTRIRNIASRFRFLKPRKQRATAKVAGKSGLKF